MEENLGCFRKLNKVSWLLDWFNSSLPHVVMLSEMLKSVYVRGSNNLIIFHVNTSCSISGCTQLTSSGLSNLIQLRQLEELELTNCPGSSKELVSYIRENLPSSLVIEWFLKYYKVPTSVKFLPDNIMKWHLKWWLWCWENLGFNKSCCEWNIKQHDLLTSAQPSWNSEPEPGLTYTRTCRSRNLRVCYLQ